MAAETLELLFQPAVAPRLKCILNAPERCQTDGYAGLVQIRLQALSHPTANQYIAAGQSGAYPRVFLRMRIAEFASVAMHLRRLAVRNRVSMMVSMCVMMMVSLMDVPRHRGCSVLTVRNGMSVILHDDESFRPARMTCDVYAIV